MLGRETTTLVNEKKKPGNYNVEVNASSASGALTGLTSSPTNSTTFVETKKLIILK